MKKNNLKRIFSAFIATAIMSSFCALPAFAELDDEDEEEIIIEDEDEEDELIIDDEDDEFEEDAEEEDPDVELIIDDEPPILETLPPDDTPAPSTQAPSYTPTGDKTMYAVEAARVRSGPGTTYGQLGTLYGGEAITVIGTSGDWLAVSFSGGTGYIAASLLTDTKPETTTTAATTPAPVTEPAAETTAETENPETAVIINPEETEATEEYVPAETEEVAETTAPATKPPKTTPAETKEEEEDKPAAAGTEDSNKTITGSGLLIAIGCAVGAFLLIGIVPIVIHKIYHNKLYQY